MSITLLIKSMFILLHCVVCGFIKLYKHDFEVMKYINYVMPTRAHNHLALRYIITAREAVIKVRV